MMSSQPAHPVHRTPSLPTPKDLPPVQHVAPGFGHKAVIPTPKKQPEKREKHPEKTGKARWKGIAAAIRFRVFAKRTPVEGHGG